jgi:hypothetical protein
MRLVILLFTVGAGMALAASAPGLCALCGTWRSPSDQSVKWVFAQDGDKLHVQEVNGAKVKADFTCNLEGKECAIKDSGHSEKVSLYLNGQTLVELCTRGNNVVKRRFALGNDGKTLDVEVMPVAPPGRVDKAAFTREE